MKLRQYELAWFFFPGLGRENVLETSENERVIAVIEHFADRDNMPDGRALLCLVERLVEQKKKGE